MAAADDTAVAAEYTYSYYTDSADETAVAAPPPQAAMAAKKVPSKPVADIGDTRVSLSSPSPSVSPSRPSKNNVYKPKQTPTQIAAVVATAPEEKKKKDSNANASKVKNSSETAIGKTRTTNNTDICKGGQRGRSRGKRQEATTKGETAEPASQMEPQEEEQSGSSSSKPRLVLKARTLPINTLRIRARLVLRAAAARGSGGTPPKSTVVESRSQADVAAAATRGAKRRRGATLRDKHSRDALSPLSYVPGDSVDAPDDDGGGKLAKLTDRAHERTWKKANSTVV